MASRWSVIVAIGLIVGAGGAWAEENSAPAAASGRTAVSPSFFEPTELEKAVADWRRKLAGTRWEVTLTPSGAAEGGAAQSDVFVFERRVAGFQGLEKEGYPSADYSLLSPTDASVSWEGMQRREGHEDTDFVTWYGKVTGEALEGKLIKQSKKGKQNVVERFSFAGRLATPEASPSTETAPDAPAAVPPETPSGTP
jgi:hypothetical protein